MVGQGLGSRSWRCCISSIKVPTRPWENFSVSNISVNGSSSTTIWWCFRCTAKWNFAFQKKCLLCHGKLACTPTAYQPQCSAEPTDSMCTCLWHGGYPRLQKSCVTPASWWCYSSWPSPPYFVPQVPELRWRTVGSTLPARWPEVSTEKWLGIQPGRLFKWFFPADASLHSCCICIKPTWMKGAVHYNFPLVDTFFVISLSSPLFLCH